MAYDQTRLAAVSEDIKSKLLSNDRDMIKTAMLAADDYFRTELRENGIRRQITPPVQVTDEELDYAEDTDFPVLYVEIAGKSAGARKVSFETGPSNEVIHGRKARVEFNRIMTPKYSIDKIRLKGYKMPLLDILHDLMLKDIMDVEDRVTLDVDNAIVGELNKNNAEIGCRRNIGLGAMTREALVTLKKAMFMTKGHLQVSKYLMNFGTYCDLGKFDRTEIGGDMAQDMFVNGVKLETLQGVDVVVTTKSEMVKNGEVFIYTDPKYYGGFYTMEDVSMVTDEQDDIWLSFFAHETIGASVVNTAGVAKATFDADASTTGWANEK